MRVPHSPHSLRKVMPVASVKQPSSDGEDFNMDACHPQDCNHKKEQEDTDLGSLKPSQASRPPRPIYNQKVKKGKHMVEVEALSTMEKNREFFEKNSMMDVSEIHEHLKEGSTNVNSMSDKDESFKADPNKVAESMSNKNINFHRGRERTRVSAVQRLVERKLAQKEKEKIRQREQDEKMRSTSVRNDLSSVHRRSASTNGYISMDALSRNRSKDRSGTRNDSRVLCSPDLPSYSSNNIHNESSNNSNKTCRTYKENKYLASLLLRTSRSCDRLYGDSNEATKTFITISSGKPTRIREQSPSKRDKSVSDQRWRAKSIDRTSTGSSISSGSSSSDEEISSPPIKVAKSVAPNFTQKVDAFLKSDTVLGKAAPLKSTGLLKEFSFIKENCQAPETEKKKETKARKTSYTTEKTIQINSETKNRRLSVDINLLSKNNSSSSAARFNFDHKRCNNSPTSDLASSPSDLSTSSSSTQSSSSSSLIGSDESSNGSIDSSSQLSSPNQTSQRKVSKSTEKTPSSDDSHLSKRRISLEQRFKARLIQPTMFPSTEKSGHEKDSEQKGSSPQPRTRERKKSKLSSAAALKIAQLNSTKLNSSSSSDSSSSNSSFQQNISETEAYCYDVENIISKEGHKYQKVSVTTKGDSRGSSTVTNAVPRRRVSQGNLAGPSSHQNRLPKGPSPRRRKHSAPVHVNKRCDNFEEKEEEIYNNQEELGFMSKLSGSRSNLFTNSQADQKKEEGNQLYKTKNYRDALQRYSEAIELCPECPAFYGNRSACHMMLSQFTQALADAKCSVQLDASFVKGYVRVSKCHVALGDAISAQQAIDKALQTEPNNAAALQEKTSIQQLINYLADYNQAYQAKDYRKSLFCLDRALAISSASRQLKISRAECLAFLGRYGEAQEVANDILRLDNINADAIYVRGLCLYNEDNVDKAFTHFQQVLRLAPDHVKAKEIYKKAKQLKQKKEEGNVAFKSGKLEDAYTLYSEALQIDPLNKYTNAKLFFNRATVAAKLKKLKESIQDCTSALELDDKYFKAVLRRAKSYMDLEMYDEAVRDYELANKMDRGNQEVRQLLQQAKLEVKKAKRKDYYKILGVSKDANDDEIKKAYRKRALVHHPDRHSSASEEEKKDAEKKFKEIGEAYGVLSDPKKRARYDQGHDIDDLEGHGHGYSSDIDPNQIFQAFFSQGGGGGGSQHFTFGGQGGMPGGFSFQFG